MSESKRELQVARRALDEGDMKHAAHHAAAALLGDPLDADVHAVVDELCDRPAPGLGAAFGRFLGVGGADPAPLFPDDGFAGNLAARSRALFRRGDVQAAFELAVQIALAVPERPFTAWLIEQVEAGREPIDPRGFLSAYAHLGRSTMGLLHLRPTEQRFFAPWVDVGLRLLEKDPDGANAPMVRMATSALARRAGCYEVALDVLDPVRDRPDTLLRITRGFALRALGRWDEAAAVFEAAMRAPDGHPTYAFEVARVFFDAGRFTEAVTWLERGEELGREEEIAIELAEERLDPRLPRHWTTLLGEDTPYDAVRRLVLGEVTYPAMSDASTNVIPQLEGEPPMELRMATTCLESPSALAALALRTLGTADPSELGYEASDAPTPHPLEPLDRTRGFRLWERKGAVAAQVVPPPPAALTEAIDELVRRLWVRDDEDAAPFLGVSRAWAMARSYPELDETDPMQLVAAMVHPTRPTARADAVRWADTAAWVFDRQVVAALLLAAQDLERPWLASRRRQSLAGLVFGHPDWTQAAALIALREAVMDDPDALDDARSWARFLVDRQPDRGHVPWADALRALARVPGMPLELEGKVVRFEAAGTDAGA